MTIEDIKKMLSEDQDVFSMESKEILQFLLDKVEEHRNIEIAISKDRQIRMENLELRFQAARNVARDELRKVHELKKKYIGISCKCLDPRDHADYQIESEYQTLKAEKK